MQTIIKRQAAFRPALPARNRKPPPARGLRELLFGSAAPTNNKYRGAATELLQLLTTKNGSGSSRSVQQLLDQLLAAEQQPFREQLLAGGPWLVLYTSGSQQLWKSTWSAGKLVNANNAASQDFHPTTKAVNNRAEYFGSRLYVSAAGTYEPLDSSATLPKRIRANITSGLLHIAGVDIALPIRGSGEFEVVYLDERLRVFRSGGALTVQVKQQYLLDEGLL